jgi:hypothetical protein
LRRADPPSNESYRLFISLRNRKIGQGPKCYRAIEREREKKNIWSHMYYKPLAGYEIHAAVAMNSTLLWDVTPHRSSVMFRRNMLPPCLELKSKTNTKLADGTLRETKFFITQFSPAACYFPFRRSRRQRNLYKEIRGEVDQLKHCSRLGAM